MTSPEHERPKPTLPRNEAPKRLRGDAGLAGGIETIALGMLIFVSVSLLIANAWAILDTHMAVTAASSEAARAAVESAGSDQAVAAQNAALDAIRGYGRDPESFELRIAANPRRCAEIIAAASYTQPMVRVPFFGSLGPDRTVTATHSERVDAFGGGRRGLTNCG